MNDREQAIGWKRVSALIIRHLRLDIPTDDPPGPCAELSETIRVLEDYVARKEREVAAARHARAMTRPRFVVCDAWGHIFSEARGDTDMRWVFDRHLWRLAALHVREHSCADWEGALSEEVADVEGSLVHANDGALWDCEGWDLVEADDAPDWAATPLPRRSRCLVNPAPQQ
jgi:hypothetical protein